MKGQLNQKNPFNLIRWYKKKKIAVERNLLLLSMKFGR